MPSLVMASAMMKQIMLVAIMMVETVACPIVLIALAIFKRLVLLDFIRPQLEMVSAMMKQILLTVITMEGTVVDPVLSQITVQNVCVLREFMEAVISIPW